MEMGRKLKAGLGVFGIAVLAGCGGGGGSNSSVPETVSYSGKTSAAVISDTNKTDLAVSSVKNVAHQVDVADQVELPGTMSVKSELDSQAVLQRVLNAANSPYAGKRVTQNALARSGMESGTITGDCGGSYSYDGTEANGVIVFSNYCTFGATINGKVNFSTSGLKETQVFNLSFRIVDDFSSEVITGSMSGTSVVVYDDDTYMNYTESFNFSVTADGETFTQAGEERYENDILVSESVFYTEGGEVYKSEVTQDFSDAADGSFSGQMKLYDPEYGYITVTATGLVPCESSFGFASGTISFSDDAGNRAVITFNGCGQNATLTFNGSAEQISLQ